MANKGERIVLGIDPGTASTGYGIVRQDAAGEYWLMACGVIRTYPDDAMPYRLREIFEDIKALIQEFDPDEMAVEQLFFGRNVTTAISVGQARGAALLAGALNELPIAEYTPASIKQALTGYGNADKVQMQLMVKQLLALDDVPRPDDAADGVAIALCHLQTVRYETVIEERGS